MGLFSKKLIRYNIKAYQIIFSCDRVLLHNKLHCRSLKSQNFYTGPLRYEKETSKPYKFTSSSANTPLLQQHIQANEYQNLIVVSSLAVFLIYFLYLREENDLDELIYAPIDQQFPVQQYSTRGHDSTGILNGEESNEELKK